jgi:hypothetical protein
MKPMGIVTLVLVGVGVLLILLGAFLSLAEWKRSRALRPREGLGDTLSGLAKLLEAMKDYPVGLKMIILGIVVLIIAGLFGGIGSL